MSRMLPTVGEHKLLRLVVLGSFVLGLIALSMLVSAPDTVVSSSTRTVADVRAERAHTSASAGSTAMFLDAPAMLAYRAPANLNPVPVRSTSTVPVEPPAVSVTPHPLHLSPADKSVSLESLTVRTQVEALVKSETAEALTVEAPVETATEPDMVESLTVDAPVVAAAPAPASVPATVGSGPAAVISQIPDSAWAWMDAYGWSVEWRQGPGPGRIAEAQYATSTMVIWYDTARSDTIWAGAFAHELGHAVSYVHFSDQQKNDWTVRRGLSSWQWVPGTPNDFTVGEGDFAEAFMWYLLGHEIRSAGGELSDADTAWIAVNTSF